MRVGDGSGERRVSFTKSLYASAKGTSWTEASLCPTAVLDTEN